MSISEFALGERPAAKARGAEFRRGAAASTPVLLGIVPYALVLGAQAAHKGLSVVEVPLMTGLNFAGGSEFAAIQLWTSPPHVLLIAAITLLAATRLSMLPTVVIGVASAGLLRWMMG